MPQITNSAGAAQSRAPQGEQASQADIVNAIRALAMDAVQKANSGHPGMPMGMAEIAEVLWRRFLKHNPANPAWPDRDRFVLSNGHGSMLQYALLHLTGYDLPIEELRNFRQLHSKTPGHPEVGYTPGVETTTGPLGQGLANAVGFALAERLLAAQFNREGHRIVDHHTYVLLGDGCLMEGISHEACSLAGVLGLAKLVAIYDDNGISIDGKVEGWFRDDTPKRFAAYGWNVVPDVDGHDARAIAAAIEGARAQSARPTLICCRTVIGKGSPNKAGTDAVHGAALGDKEVAATREAIGWRHAPFEIPEAIYREWDARPRGRELEADWNARFAAYEGAHPEAAREFRRRIGGELPSDWTTVVQRMLDRAAEKAETVATRKASQLALEALGPALPELLGGSADLTGSNLTLWSGSKAVSATQPGNYVYFGVREFAMAAIGNGISLHGGFIPYSGTFLTFSDYSRNALRMAALMRARNIFVFTHDSIGLGEDGPTHQPIEHLASVRAIPGLRVIRPADANETAAAWRVAVGGEVPVALVLSRQDVPVVTTPEQAQGVLRGGYVLAETEGVNADPDELDVVLVGTGSEVAVCVEAAKLLEADGLNVRVVSLPSWDLFELLDADEQQEVLPSEVPTLAVEAASPFGWGRFADDVVGIDRFGASAPGPTVLAKLGFTPENVAERARELLDELVDDAHDHEEDAR